MPQNAPQNAKTASATPNAMTLTTGGATTPESKSLRLQKEAMVRRST